MPLVSVIVPIYNAEAFLPMCLTSITHQTHSDLEIILVNDGSTDKSLSIAQQFANTDTRIKLVSQNNQGQSMARNKGLSLATGEYLIFVDADDYIDLNFVEQHLMAIGNADYVQSGYRRVSIEGHILEQKLPRHRYQFTSPCMQLYRTSWLKEHNILFPTGMIYEDVVFSLLFWGSKPKVQIIPYVGYNYTYNPQSTTSIVNKTAQKKLYSVIWQQTLPIWVKWLTLNRLFFHFLLKR